MANDINSSILFAIHTGNLRRVKHLVTLYGLNHFAEWSEGYRLLYEAIERESKEIARYLLTEGAKVSPNNDSSCNSASSSLLLLAADKRDLELVELLLDRGVNIEAKNQEGQTPLHVSTKSGNEELVRALLDRGACVNSVDNFGATPLHYACQVGYVSLVELLLKNNAEVKQCRSGDCYQPLHISCECGFKDITRSLLKFCADPNAMASDRVTPLHLAVAKEHLNIVELLLLYSADINLTRGDEKTPLLIAVERQSLPLVESILHHGPDVNNGYNRVALKTALIQEGQENCRIFEILTLYGFNITLEDIGDPNLLYSAACKGDVKTVEFFLNNGMDPNITVHNSTLLNIVAGIGNVKVAKLLMDAGCRVDVIDVSGSSPIDCCIRSKEDTCVEMLNLLFSRGARMTDVNQLLRRVIQRGYSRTLKILIDNGTCITNHKGLLCEAVKSGCFEICQILIQSGADVNETDEKGKSALMHSASKDIECYEYPPFQNDESNGEIRGKIAELLLKNRADVNATSKFHQSTLHLAASNGFAEVAAVLLIYKADINAIDKNFRTPLHAAVDEGQVKMTETLLKCGAKIDVTDGHIQTPLHLAVLSGKESEKIIYILLNYKAVVNCADKYLKTPLHLAIEKNQKNIVETLLKHGARVNYVEGDGLTQLHFASQSYCDSEIVGLLLKYGSEVNATVKNNLTPLHLAIKVGRRETVKLLLQNGANVDSIRSDGATPLHIAAFIKYPEKARILLQFDADINLQDSTGKTALHLAAFQRDYRIIQCLLHHGADVNATCNQGLIPLDLVEFDYNEESLKNLGMCNYKSDPYYEFYYYEDQWKTEALGSFTHHFIKLNAAGFDLREKNRDLINRVNHFFENLQLVCRDEIERIKEVKLSPNLTVYDVLIGRAGFLYTRNDAVMQVLVSILSKFPKYGFLIDRSIRNDKRKNQLVLSCEVWFNVIIRTSNALNSVKFPTLPTELREEVLSYLSIKDLRILILCGQELERQIKKL